MVTSFGEKRKEKKEKKKQKEVSERFERGAREGLVEIGVTLVNTSAHKAQTQTKPFHKNTTTLWRSGLHRRATTQTTISR